MVSGIEYVAEYPMCPSMATIRSGSDSSGFEDAEIAATVLATKTKACVKLVEGIVNRTFSEKAGGRSIDEQMGVM